MEMRCFSFPPLMDEREIRAVLFMRKCLQCTAADALRVLRITATQGEVFTEHNAQQGRAQALTIVEHLDRRVASRRHGRSSDLDCWRTLCVRQ